jgi:hypothetical protein
MSNKHLREHYNDSAFTASVRTVEPVGQVKCLGLSMSVLREVNTLNPQSITQDLSVRRKTACA